MRSFRYGNIRNKSEKTRLLASSRQQGQQAMNYKYERMPDVIAADMGGETVMVSVSSGKYFGLSGIAPIVWELLAVPISVEELVESICQSHDVDEATCRRDCDVFLDDLIHKGLASRT